MSTVSEGIHQREKEKEKKSKKNKMFKAPESECHFTNRRTELPRTGLGAKHAERQNDKERERTESYSHWQQKLCCSIRR